MRRCSPTTLALAVALWTGGPLPPEAWAQEPSAGQEQPSPEPPEAEQPRAAQPSTESPEAEQPAGAPPALPFLIEDPQPPPTPPLGGPLLQGTTIPGLLPLPLGADPDAGCDTEPAKPEEDEGCDAPPPPARP